MSDFIITSYDIYADLDEFTDSFYDEAELITQAKCRLINDGELCDMQLSKGIAEVSETAGGYFVCYNGMDILLEVKDRMISDYTIR